MGPIPEGFDFRRLGPPHAEEFPKFERLCGTVREGEPFRQGIRIALEPGYRVRAPAGPSGPPLTPDGIDLPAVQESIERRYFEEALRLAAGKETKASQFLGINYHTFRYRRRKSGL
jgi:DNA-binding NtrC family response regulator